MIVALRVYVAVFALGLLAPAAILPIVEPKLACSDTPCRGTAEILATAVMILLLTASALVAAIGVQARGARWLASVCLSVGILWCGYRMLALARGSVFDALLMILLTSWFMWGPLCIALWLCRRVSITSIPPADTEVRL
jgi:hypothetical protein